MLPEGLDGLEVQAVAHGELLIAGVEEDPGSEGTRRSPVDAVAQPACVAQLGDARRTCGLDLHRHDGTVGPLDDEVDLVALMVAVVVQPEPVGRLRDGAEYPEPAWYAE